MKDDKIPLFSSVAGNIKSNFSKLGFTGKGKFRRFVYFARRAGYVSEIDDTGRDGIIQIKGT